MAKIGGWIVLKVDEKKSINESQSSLFKLLESQLFGLPGCCIGLNVQVLAAICWQKGGLCCWWKWIKGQQQGSEFESSSCVQTAAERVSVFVQFSLSKVLLQANKNFLIPHRLLRFDTEVQLSLLV